MTTQLGTKNSKTVGTEVQSIVYFPVIFFFCVVRINGL